MFTPCGSDPLSPVDSGAADNLHAQPAPFPFKSGWRLFRSPTITAIFSPTLPRHLRLDRPAERCEAGMFNQGSRAVEAEHGGDSERSDAGPGPDEGRQALEIERDGLSTGIKVDATADHMLPLPAVESVIAESGDDATVGDEPRAEWRSEAPGCA
jgi:hypothetical protein